MKMLKKLEKMEFHYVVLFIVFPLGLLGAGANSMGDFQGNWWTLLAYFLTITAGAVIGYSFHALYAAHQEHIRKMDS